MQEVDVIYNRFGYPELRLLSDGRLVTFDGENMGFSKNDNVYNYKGTHVGWYEHGVLRDHLGNVVGFGKNPTDYPSPIFPFKAFTPFPAFVRFEPIRPMTQIPPIKPIKSFSWSMFSPISLFT